METVYCYFLWPLWLGTKFIAFSGKARRILSIQITFLSMAGYAVWFHWWLERNTLNDSHTYMCITNGWCADCTALVCCPDAALLVLYPLLCYLTSLYPLVPVLLLAVTAFLLQPWGDCTLEASCATTLFLLAREAPPCLQDNSEVKQSCAWCGRSVTFWRMTLCWGEESFRRDPASLRKLHPW